MACDRGVGVSLQVCSPFPGRGIGVACSNVFGLQAIELLLGTELVSLITRVSRIYFAACDER